MPQDASLDADSLFAVWLSHQPATSSKSIQPHINRVKEAQQKELRELKLELSMARRSEDKAEVRHLEARIKDRETIHSLELERERRDLELKNSHEKARQSEVCREFARWSDTDDGVTFIKWSTAANNIHTIVTMLSSDWNGEYKRQARSLVPAEEQERYDQKRWIEGPRFSRLFWTLIAIAVSTMALAATLALILSDYGAQQLDWLTPFFFLLFWGSLFVAAIVGYKDKNSEKWKTENMAAGHEAARSRIERFGFDPCNRSATPPSIWRDDADGTARLLLKTVITGVERHPSPAALPALRIPRLKEPDDIEFPPMRATLAAMRKEYGTTMPDIL